MANAGGISVTDSAVYKAIRTRKTSNSRKAPDTHRFTENGTRWAFLQKLLAIEEAHDKRKMTGDSLDSTFREDKYYRNYRDQDSDHSLDLMEPGSRWIHGQVLDDDSPDEFDDTEDKQEEPFKLPPLDQMHREIEPPRVFPTPENYNLQFPSILSDSGPAYSSNTSSLRQHSTKGQSLPELSPQVDEDRGSSARHKRKRPLRLPPILLPKVYAITPRPLQCREFLTPTKIRGPITDPEWEELKDCRYIRHAPPRFSLQVSPSNLSSFHF